mmetsp:Transcript_17183/g.27865  ORF Transcript_17183/g.27865 Transcript_17183/m.27865 type:complete len:205 (+) Transcript_17183:680-1294(+)
MVPGQCGPLCDVFCHSLHGLFVCCHVDIWDCGTLESICRLLSLPLLWKRRIRLGHSTHHPRLMDRCSPLGHGFCCSSEQGRKLESDCRYGGSSFVCARGSLAVRRPFVLSSQQQSLSPYSFLYTAILAANCRSVFGLGNDSRHCHLLHFVVGGYVAIINGARCAYMVHGPRSGSRLVDVLPPLRTGISLASHGGMLCRYLRIIC